MGRVVTNVGPKIKNKLGKLCLKPEISPIEFIKRVNGKKHRYFSPCETISGQKVVFYARIHDNKDAQKKFINEIRFLKKIKESRLPLTKVIPELFASGIEKSYEWLVRAYLPAPPLGYSRSLYQKTPKKIVRQLAKAIYQISKIPHKTLGLELTKFNTKNYLVANQCQGLVNRQLIPASLSHQIINLTERSLPLLKEENRYPAHSDLNLGNILVEKNHFWLIDWELVQFNNFAYDIGYLWAHLWQAPATFRNQLIKSYLNQLSNGQVAKFKKLFPIVVIYLSLGGIEYRKNSKEKLAIMQKRRRYYLNLLYKCVGSFQQLIRV